MNILIVDDDSYVIEALQEGIEWPALGIENVYTAYNVKKAKKILEEVPIHILLCDIEMPKESGLSLLKWVREKNLLLQNIFLTSYGDFEYASQAIELQTFSYALKPIAYDKLKEVIKNAIEKEKQALKVRDYQKGYESWIDTEKNRAEEFWKKLLVEKSISSMVDIKKFCQVMDLEYSPDSQFICMTVELFHYKAVFESLGDGMTNWTLKNIAEELFQKENIKIEGIVKKETAVWIFVFSSNEGTTPEKVKEVSDSFIQKIEKHFHCTVSCGIGNVCILNQLGEDLVYIETMCRDNVVKENKALILSEYEFKNIAYEPPNFAIWEALIAEGKENDIIRVIGEYLDRLVNRKKVNKEILYQFMMDFLQMVFSVLRQNHIMLHVWEYERFQGEETEEATLSVDHMRTYLEKLIRDTISVMQGVNKTKSVIETITEYMEHNIEKEISRESLAEMVYLNPDYLARLFKKEKGESIGNYLINRRISIAKEYFENTSEPVNAVAVKVGYDNFSYFSKVFKDVTGLTPKEYKKKVEDAKTS